jgi:hypothetical protein
MARVVRLARAAQPWAEQESHRDVIHVHRAKVDSSQQWNRMRRQRDVNHGKVPAVIRRHTRDAEWARRRRIPTEWVDPFR